MKTSCVFFLCFHYTHENTVYNKQKMPGDKTFITGQKGLKKFITSAKMIKSYFKSGQGLRYRAFYQPGEPVYDHLRILAHVVFDPVEHQPDKNV